MASPAKSQGIGRIVDVMIDALERNDYSALQPRIDPKTGGKKTIFDYEMRGHKTTGPKPRGPRPVGSGNFGPTANAAALCASQGKDERAARYLLSFYERQGPEGDLGHMLFEPLSHNYGGVHIEVALLMIVMAGRWPGDESLVGAARDADKMLERELALCLLHRSPGGRIIHAGTRSKMKGAGTSSPAREEFVEGAIRGAKGQSRIDRLLRLSNWSAPIALHDAGKAWGGRVHPDLLQPYLSEIRLAPGALIVTHYENGHVSRWETGPICYQSPMPANVVRYEPRVVIPFLRPGKGEQNQGLETFVEEDWLYVKKRGVIESETPLGDLGAVVTEHRIGGIPL